ERIALGDVDEFELRPWRGDRFQVVFAKMLRAGKGIDHADSHSSPFSTFGVQMKAVLIADGIGPSSIWPFSSTRAFCFGQTTVVASSCSTIAGPTSADPGPNASREKTGVS